MEFIKKLTTIKSVLIFLVAVLFNVGINFFLFNLNFIPEILSEYQKISEFVVTQFKEKNIEVKLEKSGISLNQESFLIEAKNFPIQVTTENLIFISKTANYADFKDKNTLAILNDKELVLNLSNEYQNLPLESLLRNQNEIFLNLDSIQKIQQTLFNNSGELVKNYLYTAFGVEKVIFYFAQFVWGFVIMPFVVFYILKFSGYSSEKNMIKNFGLVYYSLFLLIEPALFNFRVPVNFVHVFILGFILVTILLKKDLDKIS